MVQNDLTSADNQLTSPEQERLAELESVVSAGLTSIINTARALAEIRDSRLYRAEYTTFEEYTTERWGLSRSRAYQLVSGAKVVENIQQKQESSQMSTPVDKDNKIPTNERQTRELGKVGKEQQADAWQTAQTENQTDQPTGTQIKETIERHTFKRGDTVAFEGFNWQIGAILTNGYALERRVGSNVLRKACVSGFDLGLTDDQPPTPALPREIVLKDAVIYDYNRPGVIAFKCVYDFDTIKQLADNRQRFTVIIRAEG